MNITPTPWSVSENPIESPNNDTAATIWKDNKSTGSTLICDVSRSPDDIQGKANAQAIIAAVNGTYGIGFPSENIPELIRLFKELCRFDHAMRKGAESLVTPDNFLKAIEESKAFIETYKL